MAKVCWLAINIISKVWKNRTKVGCRLVCKLHHNVSKKISFFTRKQSILILTQSCRRHLEWEKAAKKYQCFKEIKCQSF